MQNKLSKKQNLLNHPLNETSSPCVKSSKRKKQHARKLNAERMKLSDAPKILEEKRHFPQKRNKVRKKKKTLDSTQKTMPKISIFRRILNGLIRSFRKQNK